MAKRKVKKSVKIATAVIGLLICVGLIFGISKLLKGGNTAKDGDSQSQSQMVQNDGDLELIIPDDQDTGGF